MKTGIFGVKSATRAFDLGKRAAGLFAAILTALGVTAARAGADPAVSSLVVAQVQARAVAAGATDVVTMPNVYAAKPVTTFASLSADGKTVANLDLDRYLGRWYEIATYLIPAQRNCAATTATYGLNDNGTVSVLNECRRGGLDGRADSIRGYAKIVDRETNAKLKVYFFPIFGAPYWVIEADGRGGDQPYDWAVVGSSSRSFLWILSRTPRMDETRLAAILERLTARGYDIGKLKFTEQPK
ncbi:MAG: lipocalin family protein [Deltaproteobacteria bacterium]|nr:lipocalin family protein [Deltaproteobacteria bacterium]